jgi:hypothetical protein
MYISCVLESSITSIRSFPILQYMSSFLFGTFPLFCIYYHALDLFLCFVTHHHMCLVYSFRSVCIIICVWHILFVLCASLYVLGLFLAYMYHIRSVIPSFSLHVLCLNLLWVMSDGSPSHFLLSLFDGYFHSYGCTSSYTFYSFFFDYAKISLKYLVANGKKIGFYIFSSLSY